MENEDLNKVMKAKKTMRAKNLKYGFMILLFEKRWLFTAIVDLSQQSKIKLTTED